MHNLSKIREFFKNEKIEYYSAVPLTKCRITKPYLLEKSGISADSGSALMLLAPYYTGNHDGNVSLYAVPRDYHIHFARLFRDLCELLTLVFPDQRFVGFADHSPIDEVHASAAAGLGAVGDNRMLINERYASFVFIGAVFSNMSADGYGDISRDVSLISNIAECAHCGKCTTACPSLQYSCEDEPVMCLSALTQKKGAMTATESDMLIKNNVVWGCDACQTCCPMCTPHVTEIDFFHQHLIANLDIPTLTAMNESDFAQRAYSWRGRETIMRNLQITGAME